MRQGFYLLLLAPLMILGGCSTTTPSTLAEPTVIAFGACAHENRPQPIWDAVVAAEPDLFIFTGDNIYGDTEDMDVLRAKYERLGAQPGYQRLLETCPVLATWDDHDYGVNDGGRHYPMREQSAEICMDFFGVPDDDPRRSREGIYGSQVMGEEGSRVQIILLDTRYFRDNLDRGTLSGEERREQNVVGWYQPTDDTSRTLLGEAQWQWLEEQLQVEAEVRIVSSIQVVSWEKGMECWGNMPHERDRLFNLIESTDAQGAFFISGDVHFTELSLSDEGPYPLYDLTSSGLNQSPGRNWHTSINSYRLEGMMYSGRNFGLIQINWAGDDTTITLQGRNEAGEPVYEQVVPLSDLE